MEGKGGNNEAYEKNSIEGLIQLRYSIPPSPLG